MQSLGWKDLSIHNTEVRTLKRRLEVSMVPHLAMYVLGSPSSERPYEMFHRNTCRCQIIAGNTKTKLKM